MTHVIEAYQRPSINEIFRLFGSEYLEKYRNRMSSDQIKAVVSIMNCRTPQSGSVVYRCIQCATVHRVPKSCGNRHCPTCQGHKAQQWLAEQQQRLLPCSYFMLTFTVPSEFRPFMRSHPRECYKALFDAAYQAMRKLAKDPKYLGSSNIGMTGVLHTWGRDVGYHPHVHFIVPGGAIGTDGTSWQSSSENFYLPVKALSKIYRAKYQAIMKRYGLLDMIPKEVWLKPWNVNSKAVGDGRKSLRYLAPYVFRVAIANFRIRKVWKETDGQWWVEFLVRPSGQNKYRPMKLRSESFLHRFLQHVLPTGLQKVRHFGFMHKRSKWNRTWLSMLVTVSRGLVYVLTVSPDPIIERKPMCCPECGGELECLGYDRPPTQPSMPPDTS
jgi:Putative transposase/Transposase zinc-binding domain